MMRFPAPLPSFEESSYHESSPLLANNQDQLEIVIEQEAENDNRVLPLQLLCAKKIMQSPEVYKKGLNRLPQEAHDLLAIYQPLTTENMYATFKQAKEAGDKARQLECSDFIKINAMQELTPSWGFFAATFFKLSDKEREDLIQQRINDIIPKEIIQDEGITFHNELSREIKRRENPWIWSRICCSTLLCFGALVGFVSLLHFI